MTGTSDAAGAGTLTPTNTTAPVSQLGKAGAVSLVREGGAYSTGGVPSLR
jgi:hypothetical protein